MQTESVAENMAPMAAKKGADKIKTGTKIIEIQINHSQTKS